MIKTKEVDNSGFRFTGKQKRLILAASETANRAVDAFIDLTDATTRDGKLKLLEPYHQLMLAEIELLRQAGDPDADIKRRREEMNYNEMLAEYRSYVDDKPMLTPGRAFEAARLAIVHHHYRLKSGR
jgi:hypothetical protein